MAGKEIFFQPFENAFPLVQIDPPAGENSFSIQAVLGGKNFRGVEAHLARQHSASPLFLQVNADPLHSPAGQIIGCVIILTDLTERKRAEQALAAHKQRLEELLESIQDGFMQLNRDWQFTYINQKVAKNVGWEAQAALGKNIWEKFPGIIGTTQERIFRQVMQERHPAAFEITGVLTEKSYDIRVYPAQEGISIFWVDITERKQAEQRIAAEKEWFRTTLASIGDAVITTDPQAIVTYLNPVAEQITGWTSTEAAGQPIEYVFPIINEQTGQPIENPVAQVIQSGQIVGLANHTALRARDGQIIPVEDSAAPIRDAEGQVLGVVMVFQNVTQKREEQEALRRSEVRYRSLVENSLSGILLTRPDGTILAANAQACLLFGMSEAELIAARGEELTIHDERYTAVRALRERNGQARAELTLRRKDGSTFIADISSGVFTDADGSQMTSMVIRDITRLKQVEAEREQLLKEISRQKELLEGLIQNAPLGIAVLQGPEHRFILANPAQHRLFPTIPVFVGRTVQDIWPEQADVFNPILDRVSQTGQPFIAIDAPWQTDRGQGLEEVFYSFSYSPLYSENGDDTRLLVISQDTTEQVKIRKQIEAELAERQRIAAELRESQERLLMTTGAVEIGLWDWDLLADTLVTDMRCKALFGQPPETAWTYIDLI